MSPEESGLSSSLGHGEPGGPLGTMVIPDDELNIKFV
jgi:hypothetical protein